MYKQRRVVCPKLFRNSFSQAVRMHTIEWACRLGTDDLALVKVLPAARDDLFIPEEAVLAHTVLVQKFELLAVNEDEPIALYVIGVHAKRLRASCFI